MKSNYKQLGKYIQPVNIRNTELKVDVLLGVSIQKILMPSIANTVGTNMKTYKIIKRNQFAYGPVTSRNGDKISAAILQEHDEAIVSQAYTVFEVKDETVLHPEYLMMWMRRPEFDRYARFKSHGSAREVFDWDELCETELPIPSIEKQREIVKEYNTIVNRIKLNEQLNKKLEETAQALYKHWFVDFEFPFDFTQGKPNSDGKPYKSSGGKMVYNAELDKDIPEGWEVLPISKFCDVTFSKRIFQSEYVDSGVPFYRSKEIILKKSGIPISNELYISSNRYQEITQRFGDISNGDILLTAVGTIGVSYMVQNSDHFYFKDGNLFWFKNFKNEKFKRLIYEWMQNDSFAETLEEITFGSTQKVITTTAVYLLNHVLPDAKTLEVYDSLIEAIHYKIVNQREQQKLLFELKELLLSRMTKVETKKEVV
jgi:type I restriction enzyme S subunit